MVRFFGLSPDAVMAMRLPLFWSAASHVDRLKAAEDLERLDLMIAGNAMGSGETLKEMRDQLIERVGTPTWREKPRSSRDEIMALMDD